MSQRKLDTIEPRWHRPALFNHGAGLILRWLLRLVFLLLMLAGGALGVVYPWLASRQAGYEIGTWRVFDGAAFTQAVARPAPSETPVFLTVEITTRGPLRADLQGAVLTLTARDGGTTVLAEALDFKGVQGRVVSPQSGEIAYRTAVGRIDRVSEAGLLIEAARGDEERVDLAAVDLIVAAGAIDIRPNAVPIGYVLLAVGFVGFAASLRRAKPKNPNSSPPPSPRWGRQ